MQVTTAVMSSRDLLPGADPVRTTPWLYSSECWTSKTQAFQLFTEPSPRPVLFSETIPYISSCLHFLSAVITGMHRHHAVFASSSLWHSAYPVLGNDHHYPSLECCHGKRDSELIKQQLSFQALSSCENLYSNSCVFSFSFSSAS